MKEIIFFGKNEKKWEEINQLISTTKKVPADDLSELYIQLTDDLAYAQTNYPGSDTETYLNILTRKVHQKIYKNKKTSRGRIFRFFASEVPNLMFKHRKAMLASLIIFCLSAVIGAFSTHTDVQYPRLILGDYYVDKTISNIESGNPLGIYESMDPLPMFLYITYNNIRVSFLVYAAGLFLSLGAAFILFRNGVMLGCFQYFFYTKNLLAISLLTIWVHGTLEITSIIVAGGAGIALGNSFMFPGTYSRLYAFQKGAIESVKILSGLIPLFIIAGFLEGYVTRYSHFTTIPAAIIITISILFIIYYFIYLPYRFNSNGKNKL